MPRAALLSIHARVEGTQPSTWEDPSLVQLWGPRFSAYVVAASDVAVFSLGRLPSEEKGGRRPRPASEQPSLRGADRNGPDALGRGPAADHLDRATTRCRPGRGSPRA